jgi:hypothetical protein
METEQRQPYVEPVLEKREQLVEIVEGQVTRTSGVAV